LAEAGARVPGRSEPGVLLVLSVLSVLAVGDFEVLPLTTISELAGASLSHIIGVAVDKFSKKQSTTVAFERRRRADDRENETMRDFV
jgi:hypothetical protein